MIQHNTTKRLGLIALITLSCMLAVSTYAAEPAGYYNGVANQSGDGILAALHNIIKNHTDLGYNGLYTIYPTSDVRPGTNEVWDMYSTCTFIHGQNKCGSYSSVCDCYNREHSVPASWFGDQSPMKSDAFHVIPTDGKVNNQRSNYPIGECANGTYLTSQALGKLGSSTFSGYSGTVFEVADEYKGDFARAYFYMVARYRDRDLTKWDGSAIFTRSNSVTGLTAYGIALLMKWHRQDPVSQKELDRNEAIYAHQNNRNPFIDHPCLAEYIWGAGKGMTVTSLNLDNCDNLSGSDTIPTDTVVTPPVTLFALEPVTDIHATSAVLHWTNANAAGYTVDVYERTETGVPETQILNSTAGSQATTGGYTQTGEMTGAIRLGSGKQLGSLTYTNLMFDVEGMVRVRAQRYGTDSNAQFSVTVGSTSATFTAGATDSVFEMTVPAQTSPQSLVIQTLNKGQRIYVFTVQAVTGNMETVISHVQGYPMAVGNVLQYQVTDLQPNTLYYYTVQPDGQAVSEEDMFFTEAGWTGHAFVTFPDWEYRLMDGDIILSGMPVGAQLRVWDIRGRMLCNQTVRSEQSLRLALPQGLLLIQLTDHEKTQVLKIINPRF